MAVMCSARLSFALLATIGMIGTACATAPAPTPAQTAGGTLEIGPAVPDLAPGDVRLLRQMTDRSILQHMGTMDSLEAAIAQLGVRRATDAGVRRYAGQLVADHLRSLMVGDSIARMPSVAIDQTRRDSAGPLINVNIDQAPGDTLGIAMLHTMAALRASAAGASFDRAFVSAQVRMHEHALAELRLLQNVARQGAVREHIGNVIPIIEQHLIAAQQLASSLGP